MAYLIFSIGMIAHAGSSTTQQAEEIAVIVSKIVNSSNCNENDRKVFQNFLLQYQYRNLKFKNEFFVVNWKLLLVVANLKSLNYINKLMELIILYSCSRRQQLIWSSRVNLKPPKQNT